MEWNDYLKKMAADQELTKVQTSWFIRRFCDKKNSNGVSNLDLDPDEFLKTLPGTDQMAFSRHMTNIYTIKFDKICPGLNNLTTDKFPYLKKWLEQDYLLAEGLKKMLRIIENQINKKIITVEDVKIFYSRSWKYYVPEDQDLAQMMQNLYEARSEKESSTGISFHPLLVFTQFIAKKLKSEGNLGELKRIVITRLKEPECGMSQQDINDYYAANDPSRELASKIYILIDRIYQLRKIKVHIKIWDVYSPVGAANIVPLYYPESEFDAIDDAVQFIKDKLPGIYSSYQPIDALHLFVDSGEFSLDIDQWSIINSWEEHSILGQEFPVLLHALKRLDSRSKQIRQTIKGRWSSLQNRYVCWSLDPQGMNCSQQIQCLDPKIKNCGAHILKWDFVGQRDDDYKIWEQFYRSPIPIALRVRQPLDAAMRACLEDIVRAPDIPHAIYEARKRQNLQVSLLYDDPNLLDPQFLATGPFKTP